jgi:peptidoglycan/LPS O-acetylase OafA/YrhL
MVFGTATVVVATLSWHFLEQPINRFRSRTTRTPALTANETVAPSVLTWQTKLAHEN